MTSKVMEANAGIHSLGMAVAVSLRSCLAIARSKTAPQPVTSWRLYGERKFYFRHASLTYRM